MKRLNKLRSCIVIAYLLAAPLFVFAQDRQGNIVEYFGKEKVTEVHEGTTLHTFREGLLLPGSSSSRGSETLPPEPVIASLLLENKLQPSEASASEQRSREWEPISVDEKNEFNNRRLRSGYLQLSYESETEQIVLLDASGHTKLFVNGLPREGDHYDYGWSLVPVQLQAGTNTFVMTGGRFPRMRARLLKAHSPVQLTPRDKTLPDILLEEQSDLLGAVRVLNASEAWFRGTIVCQIGGLSRESSAFSVSPLNSRKVPFHIPVPESREGERMEAKLLLNTADGETLSTLGISLRVISKHIHHNRTFRSDIDGSVQYFGVAPSTNPSTENQALFLSVHGASVEASGQARAYKSKDWGYLVAPTNRRAFGFAWEDWGRLDAMEVLNHAEKLYQTDPHRTYLTGHSMGGHGTWYLGATYPDRFAAIAPAAGYPDLLEYRNSFRRRLRTASDDDLKRFGVSRERAQQLIQEMETAESNKSPIQLMIERAGNPSRTLKLKRNYLQQGVYVLHGEKDTVVPTFLAREMREVLATFHPDFTYYEYPDGTHWYGNHSVDWPPIFDFFDFRTIKASKDVKKLEFYTASPGVSASSHFATILQQKHPFEISSFTFERNEVPEFDLVNVETFHINLDELGAASSVILDGQELVVEGIEEATFRLSEDQWQVVAPISHREKGPHRNGGFKDAFRNEMLLVFGTGGSPAENRWNYNRARLDSETFWYRGNGNVELLQDTSFSLEAFPDRNVILYGNRDQNSAWDKLLKDCPLQIRKGALSIGDRLLLGEHFGALFIYPRKDSKTASVGVVAGSGIDGMKSVYSNRYLQNGSTFPDLLILNRRSLADGVEGVVAAGFFGNDWSIENGEIAWQ